MNENERGRGHLMEISKSEQLPGMERCIKDNKISEVNSIVLLIPDGQKSESKRSGTGRRSS